MNTTFLTGLIGSLILVTGAGWPESKKAKHPVQSFKNWLFLLGGVWMLIYSLLGYFEGGLIFFVFIQIQILIANIMGMIDIDDRIDAVVIGIAGVAFIIWSLYLFQGYTTVLFIVGLFSLALGYSWKIGTLRRDIALTLGSLVIAIFSYLEASWIFFWLNVFFAIFSGYYLFKTLRRTVDKK